MKRALNRLRRPPTTVRWRLTLLYGGLFLVCGAGLLVVTYTLVDHASVARGPQAAFTATPPSGATPGSGAIARRGVLSIRAGNHNQLVRLPPGEVPPDLAQVLKSSAGRAVIRFVGAKQRVSDLHQLEIESAIALAIMALISGLLGWVVAGRVLRPLRTITATTQQLSEVNLHERLALAGPRDELRTLADTIDGLLGRLERAFDAQRRFVTNASHELRTPLAASRALLEMALSDREATVESLRTVCHEALEESEQQEQLIDALLTLAQGERGLDTKEPLDLSAVIREVERVYQPEAAVNGVMLKVTTDLAEVQGDRRLLGRLVSNLLQNAIRHNIPGGRVQLRLEDRPEGARLTVANTGPVVPAEEIPRLLQPFQRIAPDRTGHREGFGLGLSIVAAVAAAHDAALDIRSGADGGLVIKLGFPRVASAALAERGWAPSASAVAHDAQDHRAGSPASRAEDEPQVGVG
ncbi:MAG TPA: ATP-binding protein [Solirubrobacteraceae bacterium]|nr:ATP-binding protein [Solirubrobacteraceae bacterium]